MQDYLHRVVMPDSDSHKGQNGKLLVIGGSSLFHAPVLWSAQVASRVVDMVHVTSPYVMNNQLMEYGLKRRFWNGIVVPWEVVEEYIAEDDVVLIGPGMTRSEETAVIVNRLLKQFPQKRWVVDGGALQMVEADLLNQQMMVTPHQREWVRIKDCVPAGVTVLLKGMVDVVTRDNERVEIPGGNPGMTKGGTGDVLAGLAAALATTNDLMVAAVVASAVVKAAGDALFARVGRFYNATDVYEEIPRSLHRLLKQ